MTSRHMIWIVLLMLGVIITLGRDASAQTRLGLHVTQEELNIWKQRAKDGPYKTNGDVRTNSPGDWTRILSNANAFRSNPSGERYNGGNVATGPGGCVTNTKDTSGPSLSQGDKLRDAGFVYLVTGDTSYRDAVRAELLAQIAERGVDFTNTAKWNHNSGCLTGGVDPTFELANWLNRLLHGYDYIRASLSSQDRAKIEAWFLTAARFFDYFATSGPSKRFPNRERDDYSSSPLPRGDCANTSLYYGGPCRYEWHDGWNNLNLLATRFTGLAGILLNDATLKSHAKRFVKEWFAYIVYPDGSQGELDRWASTSPDKGIGYWGGALAHVIALADAFARSGDPELYTYTTSAGMYGTAGGQKGLSLVLTRYLQYRDHTVRRYATTSSGGQTDSTLIDGVDASKGWQSINDISNGTMANLYYKSDYIKLHYTRTRTGLPAYPKDPAGGQGWWGGTDNIFPGMLFMFGQMEGKVWPYPGEKPEGSKPTPPQNFRLSSAEN